MSYQSSHNPGNFRPKGPKLTPTQQVVSGRLGELRVQYGREISRERLYQIVAYVKHHEALPADCEVTIDAWKRLIKDHVGRILDAAMREGFKEAELLQQAEALAQGSEDSPEIA